MKVPFLDLKSIHLGLQPELTEAFDRFISSGHYILGAETEAFEKEFASFTGAKHSLGVGNGLDALYLILKAMGIGPGDEVIVPGHTFVATWLAVSYVGATPVGVDCLKSSFNI